MRKELTEERIPYGPLPMRVWVAIAAMSLVIGIALAALVGLVVHVKWIL